MRIPLSAPDISETEIDAVVAVLRGSQLSLGPKMEEFEVAVADYVGVRHGIAVSSGTAGLHLALLALEIGDGDEVIVPSFTFIAAANAVRYVGATPVFVDIDEATLNMSVDAVESAITPRTRAMVVVHTFGRPAEMGRLMTLAQAHGLLVVEDACEALGAEVGGRRVGGLGDVGVFAFYPNKQITTGEGGMIVTSNAEYANRMRALRNQGRDRADDWFQHTELGYNYRLSEIACALGVEQMKRLPEILAKRASVARAYDHRLNASPHLVLPELQVADGSTSWFVYVVRLTAEFDAADRDAIIAELKEAGIGCGRYFAPIHKQPAYSEWSSLRLPVTEAVAKRTIALPFFNRLSNGEVADVVSRLMDAISNVEASREVTAVKEYE